ncbi:MAG TPA: NAD(P)/FAD-dependent oxidoreductase [Amycolatopsis sp.]|nr:NAD(P)/FAD-dependent oxidoreductase [Amycolatopsis sp.]
MDKVDRSFGPEALSPEQVRAAVAVANIPALLMVVFQMTGDERWLEPPYQPTRGKGLGDHDDGGLPEPVQAEIRAAAEDAILRLQAGERPAITAPSAELTARMAGVCMGEPVGIGHGTMLSVELARRSGASIPELAEPVATPPPGYRVLVIGTGVAGIAAAHQLQDMGVDYTILEKQPEPGGNWWQNTYPGAGVDTPSHLYSFSFAKEDWSRHFEMRDDIQRYFTSVLKNLGADEHIRYGTEVTKAAYDDRRRMWHVDVRNADGTEETLEADVVISAVGALNRPKWPELPGMDRFRGVAFHSAQWPDELDLDGKRVAVVGSGASSMQIVPAIVDRVGELVIFQRSPQWVAPFEKFHVPIPDELRMLLQACPLYYSWYWVRLFWQFGDKVIEALRKDPEWPHPERAVNARNDGHRRYFTRYLEEQLRDRPDLLPKTLPDYPPFGKRILLDNGWYAALKKDHVTLVAEAVSEVTERGLVSESGTEHDVDIIVWATGFRAAEFLASLEVYGVDGARLRDVWRGDDPRGYLGVSVPGFPNFFMLGGPNSFPGSGSFMYFMEVQMRYLRGLLTQMWQRGIKAVDARQEVSDAYNDLVDETHDRTVWTHPGMRTYYRNSRGRVVYVMPFLNVEYWQMTRNVNLDDYTQR